MIGRAAVTRPWVLADPGKTRAQVVRTMVEYARKQDSLRHVTRHLLGLYHGMPPGAAAGGRCCRIPRR